MLFTKGKMESMSVQDVAGVLVSLHNLMVFVYDCGGDALVHFDDMFVRLSRLSHDSPTLTYETILIMQYLSEVGDHTRMAKHLTEVVSIEGVFDYHVGSISFLEAYEECLSTQDEEECDEIDELDETYDDLLSMVVRTGSRELVKLVVDLCDRYGVVLQMHTVRRARRVAIHLDMSEIIELIPDV